MSFVRSPRTYSRLNNIEQSIAVDEDLSVSIIEVATDDHNHTTPMLSTSSMTISDIKSSDTSSAESHVTSSKQPLGALISAKKFSCKDHFEKRKVGDEERYCCRVPGCTTNYSVKSGTQHKKQHIKKHFERQPFIFSTSDERVDLIIRLFTFNALSFSVMENPHFRALINVDLSRKELTDHLVSIANLKKSELKQDLSKTDYVSMTIDIWTNRRKGSFVCFTLHYIIDFEFHSSVAEFKPLPLPQEGDLKTMIREVFEFYDIKTKCVAITADFDAKNKSQLNILSELDLPSIGPIRRLNCVCDAILKSINRSVDSTSPHGRSIHKARALCAKIKSKYDREDLLEAACRETSMEHQKILIDVKSKWNSLYCMIDRLLVLRCPLEWIFSHPEHRFEFSDNERLTSVDWSNLITIKAILNPIYEASVHLSSFDKPTFSNALVLYRVAIDNVSQSIYNEINFAQKLRENLLNYLPFIDTVDARLATVLDPNWNIGYFDDAVERDKLSSIVRHESGLQDDSSQQQSTSGSGIWAAARRNLGSQPDELTTYISMPPEVKDSDGTPVDVLFWWKLNQSRFVKLCKLAIKYLTMQSSCSASMCNFSQADDFINMKRCDSEREAADSCIILRSLDNDEEDDSDYPDSDDDL